jgi:quercetin dioxygenase-like cupin family protein
VPTRAEDIATLPRLGPYAPGGRGDCTEQAKRLAHDTGSNHQSEENTMKRIATSIVLLAGFSALAAPAAFAQRSATHVMMSPAELTWNDLPSLPGVKIAVIEGPLNAPVPVMFRLKFPANYKVPPHWHPGVEHITIISGTLNMGMGDTFDMTKTRALTPGSVAIMPAETHHFVWTNEEAIGQVHSTGPWSVTYVNPADDPSKK